MRKKRYKINKVRVILAVLIVLALIIFISSKIPKDDTMPKIAEEKDTVSPEIKLKNGEKVILAVGEKFIPNIVATDNIDGDITDKVEYTDIDTSKKGRYDVKFSAKDRRGNKATATQKVEVREKLKSGLPVLMYHFFYDDVKYFSKDSNWLSTKDFEEQLKYLKEEDFYFPSWKEVEGYIDGKIRLPEKSVVLTVDDGDASFFDLAVPLLQKYKVPATSFVISEWYGWRYDPNLEYVVFESHSESMHEPGANGKGRMVNWDYDEIVADLKKSKKNLGDADIFCYPFGHYNETAIKALKDTGYKLAFTIEGGRVEVGDNKYKLPRVRVTAGNSLNYFKSSCQ